MTTAADTRTPTISRVLEDGRLVELLYDPGTRQTALAVAAGGQVTVCDSLDLASGERLVPYAGDNNLIATGCVLLPSEVGAYNDKGSLLAEVRAYLHRYVDLSEPFAVIAAHYALLTWVYDAFRELPYLRFRGDYGTGKTRALMALGSICYKPFFASGASTVSPIFHILDAFGGTLVLDEADFRFTDATANLTKILNNGSMAGLPVLRTMSNRHRELNPRAFRVFGPKLVGMRMGFSDPALESRFLTEETGVRALRADIPLQQPAKLAADALALRNKLLGFRVATRHLARARPEVVVPDIEPRLNQTASALLSIIDETADRDVVAAELRQADRRLRADRAASDTGRMVRAVLDALAGGAARASVAAITTRFNALSPTTAPVTPRWTGWFLRTRLGVTPVRVGGAFEVSRADLPKFTALAARYLGLRHTEGQEAA